MRKRVKIAVALLAGAKCLNVCVPIIFKNAVDTLNSISAQAGSEAVLGMGTAPETVTTVATALLLGCKEIQSSSIRVH